MTASGLDCEILINEVHLRPALCDQSEKTMKTETQWRN
jgi:hypothetical protein